MGLDAVELVMEVEEAFGIQIPDEEASRIQTVGDLHRYILRMLGTFPKPVRAESGLCLSTVAFHRLRREMIRSWNVSRAEVRPSAEVAALIGPNLRRFRWDLLSVALGWKLPRLVRPRAVRIVGRAVLVTVPLLLALYGWIDSSVGLGRGIAASLIALPVISWLLERLSRPLATCLPDELRTLRDLVEQVVVANLAAVSKTAGRRPDADEVWRALRAILVRQLGVPPERVIPSARFVEDLGLS